MWYVWYKKRRVRAGRPSGSPGRALEVLSFVDETDRDERRGGEPHRSSLIYCGFCGALNPATSHYCAACGATLVDAFHATEGLRVYERPDSASPLIEIIPAQSSISVGRQNFKNAVMQL